MKRKIYYILEIFLFVPVFLSGAFLIRARTKNQSEKYELAKDIQNLEVNQKTLGKKTLTLCSWNIWRNYNSHEIKNSLVNISNVYSPDVFLFQESPVYKDKSFIGQSFFKNKNAYYAPLHRVYEQGQYYNYLHTGQATVSTYGFFKKYVYALPMISYLFSMLSRGKFKLIRISLYNQLLTTDKKKIGIYNVHLENMTRPKGRLVQIEYLLKKIAENDDDVVIVGGDFNTFMPKMSEPIFRLLKRSGFIHVTQKDHLPRLDHFFVKGAESIFGKRIAPDEATGSDHQPIVAKIRF